MRANTPEQKREIIERLYKVWIKMYPLRLGQLIQNLGDVYYTEDYKLIVALEQAYASARVVDKGERPC